MLRYKISIHCLVLEAVVMVLQWARSLLILAPCRPRIEWYRIRNDSVVLLCRCGSQESHSSDSNAKCKCKVVHSDLRFVSEWLDRENVLKKTVRCVLVLWESCFLHSDNGVPEGDDDEAVLTANTNYNAETAITKF